ncbi:hypothetical protein CTAYLR_008167 [Chrysophaeum taylorii]|uniref:Beta-hexosaminidase n=1 Tax=Chrysophaeum taylorii TaxID=2483200 RepID=A0AAD7XGI4_9STRA|nr:hypothetical protein CTAYLR_008167 [Chrysophaeum taylorii]
MRSRLQKQLLYLVAALARGEDACGDALLPVSGAGMIWPLPFVAEYGSSSFAVDGVVFELSRRARESRVVARAAARYERALSSSSSSSSSGDSSVVRLELEDGDAVEEVPQLSSFARSREAYELRVSSFGGEIRSTSTWGLLRGLATLRQLYLRTKRGLCVPYGPWRVADRAAFPWRGVLVDTGRRFYPLRFWAQLLDAMERVKLNAVHWHATDDESVPVASKSLPNASRLGAFGPGAVYDADAVSRIVKLAADRGIRIVPEFDGPAHALGFSLARPDLFCGDLYDVTREDLYEELLAPWFNDARRLFPDDVAHLGGDEVNPSAWNESASVLAWLAANDASLDSLFPTYARRVANVSRRAGFRLAMAWDDVLAAGVETDVVHAWRGKGGSPVVDDPWLVDAATSGLEVVTSHGLYLTAGHGVDDDLVVKWQDIYDRDILAPLGGNETAASYVLGAEACVWGTSVDARSWDSTAWPRLAVFAERVWARNDSFTPGNYTDILPRLMLLRCRLLDVVSVAPIDDPPRVSKRSFLEQCDALPPLAL